MVCALQVGRRSARVQRFRVGRSAGHDTDHHVRLGTGSRHVHRGHRERGRRRARQRTVSRDDHEWPLSSDDRRLGQRAGGQRVFDVISIGARDGWGQNSLRATKFNELYMIL